MKFYPLLKISFLFLFMALSVQLFADDEVPAGIVRGRITTSDGKPAAYVSVSIDELDKGAVSNDDGEYVIRKVPAGQWTIKIIAVGKATQERTITVSNGKTTEADFQITETALELNEVVVNAQRQKTNASDYMAKMPLKNLENSQVYATVPKQLIADQMLNSVDDAMHNVTGIQSMWNATGRAGDGGSYYSSRGFIMQSNLRNGIAGIISGTADAANIESVEVLKGPAATLFGSVLTSYGGLINRITKKPYDNFGGEVSAMAGSYDFSRVALDINTPLNNAKTVLFRLNTAYNYQGTFQTVGFARRVFVAPSLLIKASKRLTLSFDAELTYGEGIGQQYIFFYYPTSMLGYTSASQIPVDYKNSYMGRGLSQQSRSGNYFGNATYKISDAFTSSTNISYSHSYSNGFGPYSYLVPTSGGLYLARADQSTYGNSHQNDVEVQQNFTGDFRIGNLRNRLLFGLDYTNINKHIFFKSNASYFDTIPLFVPNYDYNAFNATSMQNYYDTTTSGVGYYPERSITNVYSAYVSDVLNLTDKLSVIAAVRADHFVNKDHVAGTKYDQTVFSPKFGIVYQPVLDRVSLFANYQSSFTNENSYYAYTPVAGTDSATATVAKPEHADQWEAGIKTNFINNRLSGSFSYYHIKVSDMLYANPNDPNQARGTQLQNGVQVSQGVEFDANAQPVNGLNILAGVSYNDSKMVESDASILGRRPSTASSPWLAHWWLSYQFQQGTLNGLHIGFGGQYASDNKIVNSTTMGVFTLPAYTVLNVVVSYAYKKMVFGVKADNLTNKHYWNGYTTMNPQMLRQFVASVSCMF